MRYRAVLAIFLVLGTAGGAAAPPPDTHCTSGQLDELGPLPLRDGPAQP